jgi:hypothetical protein
VKAKRSGIRDVLLGKVAIPKKSDVIEENAEGEKEMMKAVELNEITFTENIYHLM